MISQASTETIMMKALLIRRVEETLLELYAAGKINGTIHTCIGQELTGVMLSEFLNPHDAVFSNHRCHGHYLAFKDDVEGLIAEIMGSSLGVCGGRGGSQHLCKNGFYSNGVQGGMSPIAVGVGWAKKRNQPDSIAVMYLGDGTLGEGIVYEAFNLASKLQVPVLFVLENNQYAQSTHVSETLAGDICDRAEAFNIRTMRADTWDWENLYAVANDITTYVRTSVKPAFLQIDTYRLMAHSKGDDHRAIKEVNYYASIDPLNVYLSGMSDAVLSEHMTRINARIQRSIDRIKTIDYESLIHAFQSQALASIHPIAYPKEETNSICISRLINQALLALLKVNPKVILIGEDIKSPYGGAFKVTDGLSDKYPTQVYNMPISEAGIVGLGTGLALNGYLPIVEIMFGDFISLAFDQLLNHASKFRAMYNEQVNIPLIIRTPMGAGRGYGPTHSQTLDKHLLGIPGLRIVALNPFIHPGEIYLTLIESNQDPTLVIENKHLYTRQLYDRAPDGFYFEATQDALPTILVLPESNHVDITLLGYGALSEGMIQVIERLFYEHDLIAQLICPTVLYPFEISYLLPYIQKSHVLFTVEEGGGFASFGAEVISQVAAVPELRHILCKRISSPDMPIPASKVLEDLFLHDQESIIQSILEVYHANHDVIKSEC